MKTEQSRRLCGSCGNWMQFIPGSGVGSGAWVCHNDHSNLPGVRALCGYCSNGVIAVGTWHDACICESCIERILPAGTESEVKRFESPPTCTRCKTVLRDAITDRTMNGKRYCASCYHDLFVDPPLSRAIRSDETPKTVKPTLGFMPRKLWLEERRSVVLHAIHERADQCSRLREADDSPLDEWMAELHWLNGQIVLEKRNQKKS